MNRFLTPLLRSGVRNDGMCTVLGGWGGEVGLIDSSLRSE